MIEISRQKINGRTYIKCLCECGEAFTKRSDNKKISCNICTRREKHGDSNKTSEYNRLYVIWMGMNNRCNLKSNYAHVSVCTEWTRYIQFKKWALNNGYTNKLTIDRISNNGNYEKSNCRWVDMHIQANNRNSGRKKKRKYPLGVRKTRIGNFDSRIMVKKQEIALGTYKTVKEAEEAYISYATKHNLLERVNNYK